MFIIWIIGAIPLCDAVTVIIYEIHKAQYDKSNGPMYINNNRKKLKF